MVVCSSKLLLLLAQPICCQVLDPVFSFFLSSLGLLQCCQVVFWIAAVLLSSFSLWWTHAKTAVLLCSFFCFSIFLFFILLTAFVSAFYPLTHLPAFFLMLYCCFWILTHLHFFFYNFSPFCAGLGLLAFYIINIIIFCQLLFAGLGKGLFIAGLAQHMLYHELI